MNRHQRLLQAIARIACGYPKSVLAVALLLTAAAWIPPLVGGVDQAFNAARLLPQDVPAARDFANAIIDYDTIDESVVVIRLGTPAEAAREGAEGRLARQKHLALAGRLADRIVERLRDPAHAAYIHGVFCRKYSEEDRDYLFYEGLPDWGLLLTPESEWDALENALRPESVRQAVAALARRLTLPVDATTAEAMALFNAAGLAPIFQRSLGRSLADGLTAGGGGSGTAEGGDPMAALGRLLNAQASYLVDSERRMLLVAIQPTQPAQSLKFARELCALVRREAAAAHAEIVPAAAANSARLEFAGGYEVALAYMTSVNEALLNTVSTSLIGVVLLFGFGYRRPGVFIYIGVPLLMVVSWTLGTGWLIFGQLNLVSCSFAAVLIALGIDYAVHIYNRYIEERARLADVSEAFRRSLVYTGGGVFMGMVTTAAAFLGMLGTRFSQLVEFGALASIGLALSVPIMFFVMPAIITLRDRIRPEKASARKPVGFGLPPLARFIERRSGPVAAVGIGLAAACLGVLALFPDRPAFDSGIHNLRPPARAFELSADIARAFADRNPRFLMLISYSGLAGRQGEEDAMEKAADIAAAAARLEKEPEPDGKPALAGYESLARLLPAPSRQRRLLARLARVDFDGALAAFRDASARAGLAGGMYADHLGFTAELLERHRDRVREGRILLPSDLGESPVGRYIRRLVVERRREVDLRRPLPADLAFPAVLDADAVARSGELRQPAGTEFAAPEALGKLIDPALPRLDQVKRVLLKRPGWAVKTKIYLPPPEEGSRAREGGLEDAWVERMRGAFGAPESDRRSPDDALLTGVPLLSHELARIVKSDMWRLSVGVTAAALLALLAFHWRHPRRIATCMLPIGLGVAYMLGIMSVSGFDFNFVNTLAVPIIIGLGVDNGIHLTERFHHDGGGARGMVADTGRAVVVTGLTSVIGFGSLALVGMPWTVLAAWCALVGAVVALGMRLAARTGDERRQRRISAVSAGAAALLSLGLWAGWGMGGGVQDMGLLMILGLSTLMFASLTVFPAVMVRFVRPETFAAADLAATRRRSALKDSGPAADQ